MAATESAELAVFKALLAVYTADSDKFGAGSVSQGIRNFSRMQAPGDNLTGNYILVEAFPQVDDTLDNDYVRVAIRMHIYVNKDVAVADDNSAGELDAIMGEIRRLYHRKILADTSDWGFNRVFITREIILPRSPQAEERSDLVHAVVEMELTAKKL